MREPTLSFSMGAEGRLFEIQGALLNKGWRPGKPREFKVLDPKPRLIQAPVFADRVVHHAVVRQIMPHFERRFIADSYACREGKGVQQCVSRLQSQMRRAQGRWGEVYALKADIAKYFASIDHEVLTRIIGRIVSDRDVVDLISKIIAGYGHDGGKGLPVGALTSQLFANAYLDRLDHTVKDEWGQPFYVRYMDDFVILGPDKSSLWRVYEDVAQFLATELRLRLNRKTGVFPVRCGIDFCGYRTWSTHILPRKRNVKRARRRFRSLAAQYAEGRISSDDIQPTVASFIGYMRHCSGHRTQSAIMADILLKRSPETDNGNADNHP